MQLLEAARIRAYLEEVADELGSEGPDHEIVIVGGSCLPGMESDRPPLT